MGLVKIIVLTVLLAGCLSTSPQAWRAPADDGGFQRAAYTCKQRVNDELWRGAAFGGVIVPIVALSSQRAVFRECMEGHGFVPAD